MITEEHISAEQWEFVRNLINDIARAQKRDEFVGSLFQWDLAVRQFRRVELNRVILGDPDKRELDLHAVCAHLLLGIGHALKMLSDDFTDEELAAFAVTRGQIAAYVEELEQSFREWHHGLTPEEVRAAEVRIFGETPEHR